MRTLFRRGASSSLVLMLAIVLMVTTLAPLARAGTGSIGSGIDDFGEDTNGNGLYDHLVITVPVQVTSSGGFFLDVELYDSTLSTWITSGYANAYLGASTTLGVELSGLAIRTSGIDGPYHAVVVLYNTDGNFSFLDMRDYTTHAYLAREFETAPIVFAPPHSDAGLDLNGDGLFELLQVQVNLDVTTPGTYVIQGSMQDTSSYTYYDSASETVTLPIGPATVFLNYSGYAIQAAGVDGPYQDTLYAEDPSFNVLAADVHFTQAYSPTMFEPLPAALVPPCSDFGVDTDGDGLYNAIGFSIPLAVAAPATYELWVVMRGANGTPNLGMQSLAVVLGPGNPTVEVDASTLPMVQLGLDGPYQAEINLMVQDPHTDLWVSLGRTTFQTAAYTVSQFDGLPASIGPEITDEAMDRSSPPDGLYDVLAVNLSVDVQAAGTYVIEGVLYDPMMNQVCLDDFYLPESVGVHNVTLYFPGPTIRLHGWSGAFDVDLALFALAGGHFNLIGEQWYTTGSYASDDFAYASPAMLDGYLLDASTHEPVPYTQIEAFNYDWLQEAWAMTDASGYYAMPVEEGTWVVTPEPFDTYEQTLVQVNVTAPTTSLDFDLLPEVTQMAFVNLTFDDWSHAARDRAWIFSYQAETARQYYDWWNGNRDGYLMDQEYLDALGSPGSLPTPLPDLSTNLFQVDDGSFDLVPGSNAYTPSEIAGSIFDPRPMTGVETGAYTDASGPGAGAVHTIRVNVSYDLTWNNRIYRVSLPAGYVAQSVTAPPEMAISGLGTENVTIDPPVPEGGNTNTSAWAWATIVAAPSDVTPPEIGSAGVSPVPAEVGQTATFSAGVTDDTGVRSVTLEIWDPDGTSLGNFSLSGSDGTYAHNFVPEKLGTYTYTVVASDVLQSTVVTGSFEVSDSLPPTIGSVQASPDPTELGADTTLAAAVSDPGGVATVTAEVHGPSGDLIANYSMTYDSVAERWMMPQTFDTVGAYAFTIWATDASGNVAASSGTFDVVDTTAPILSDVSATPDPAELQGPVTFAFAASDLGGVVSASVEVRDSADVVVGTYPMSFNAVSGHWETTQSFSGLGTFTYTVTALDASGNPESASGSFVVRDTTAPTVGSAAAAPNPAEVGSPTTITATVTDAQSVLAVFVEFTDANGFRYGNYTMTGSGGIYTSAFTPTVTVPLTYTIWAQDPSGNWGTASGTLGVVDTTPPVIASQSVTPSPQEVGTSVLFQAQLTDNAFVAGASVEVHGPDGALVGNYSLTHFLPGNGWQKYVPFTAPGTYTYTLWVVDGEGNFASASGTFVMEDTTAPAVTGVAAAPSLVELGTPTTVSATVTDIGGLASVKLEVRDSDANVVGNYTMTAGAAHLYSRALIPTKLGTYTFTVTATDSSGNVKVVTGSFVVEDTTAPTANAGPDQAVSQGATVTFDGSASTDNDAVASYAWTFDDGGAKTLTGAHPTYTFSHAGTYTVTLTVMDASGNTATDTITVTVSAVVPTTGSISGTVKDDSGLVIANATVHLMSGATQVATTTADSAGRFAFTNVPAGTYTLRAEAAGHNAASTNVTVVAGQTAQAAITLTLTPSAPAGLDLVFVGAIVLVVAAAAVGAAYVLLRRRKP